MARATCQTPCFLLPNANPPVVLQAFADELGTLFIETSAKANDNVDETFTQISSDILRKGFVNPRSSAGSGPKGVVLQVRFPAGKERCSACPRVSERGTCTATCTYACVRPCACAHAREHA